MGKGTGFVTQFTILSRGMPKFSSEADNSEARSISFSRAGRMQQKQDPKCIALQPARQAMLDMPGSPKSETRCQLILVRLPGWYENQSMYAYVGMKTSSLLARVVRLYTNRNPLHKNMGMANIG